MGIRFTPEVSSRPSLAFPFFAEGQGLVHLGQGIAHGAQELGSGIDSLVRFLKQQEARQEAEERAFANAAAAVDATTRANEAINSFDERFERRKQALLADKRFDRLIPEFEEIANEDIQRVALEHLQDQYHDLNRFRFFTERAKQERIEKLRAERATLLTQHALKELELRTDRFQQEGQSKTIEELEQSFLDLQQETDTLVATNVIDAAGRNKILRDALEQTLIGRARMRTLDNPEEAPDILREEFKRMRPYLLPLQNAKLVETARAEREAGRKELTATQDEAFRQIQNAIIAGGMLLDDAVEVGRQHGVDPLRVEQFYTQYHSLRQAEVDRRREDEERFFKEFSRNLRTNALEKAAKDKQFDVLRFIDRNRRNLTDEDREFLISAHEKIAAARANPSATDAEEFARLLALVDDHPNEKTAEAAVLNARKAGKLGEDDFEKLLTRLNNNRQTLLNKEEEKLSRLFTQGLSTVDEALQTTGAQTIDPLAQQIKVRVKGRLRGAMYGPEQVIGDYAAFRKDPVNFIAQVAREGRKELDQSLGEEGLRLMSTHWLGPQMILPDGGLNRALLKEAIKEGILDKIEAERIAIAFQQVQRGLLVLPEGLRPKPPAPAPEPQEPESKSRVDQILDFLFSAGEEKPEKRKPKREPKF